MRKDSLLDWFYPVVDDVWGKSYLLKEEKDKWVISFLTPGLEKKDLKISLKKSALTVKWEIPKNTPAWELGVQNGNYVFTTDVRVKPEHISATCKNGILTVEVQKPQEVVQSEQEHLISVS